VIEDYFPVPTTITRIPSRAGAPEQATGAVPDMANAGAAMAATGRGTCGRVRSDISEIPSLGKRRGRCHDLATVSGPDGSDKPSGGKSAIPNTGGTRSS
jgi:hypothetical protein